MPSRPGRRYSRRVVVPVVSAMSPAQAPLATMGARSFHFKIRVFINISASLIIGAEIAGSGDQPLGGSLDKKWPRVPPTHRLREEIAFNLK